MANVPQVTHVNATTNSGIHPTELYAGPLAFNMDRFNDTIKADLQTARTTLAGLTEPGDKAKHAEVAKAIKALEAAQKIILKHSTILSSLVGGNKTKSTDATQKFNQRVLGLPIGVNPANPFVEMANLRQALTNFVAQVKDSEKVTAKGARLTAEKNVVTDLNKAIAALK